jgi:hypothetical protein
MSTKEFIKTARKWSNHAHPTWKMIINKTILSARAAQDQVRAAQALNKITRALFAAAVVQAALIVGQILVTLKVIRR